MKGYSKPLLSLVNNWHFVEAVQNCFKLTGNGLGGSYSAHVVHADFKILQTNHHWLDFVHVMLIVCMLHQQVRLRLALPDASSLGTDTVCTAMKLRNWWVLCGHYSGYKQWHIWSFITRLCEWSERIFDDVGNSIATSVWLFVETTDKLLWLATRLYVIDSSSKPVQFWVAGSGERVFGVPIFF